MGGLLSYPLNWFLGGCFRLFNAAFLRATSAYTRIVGLMLRLSVLSLLVYGGLLFLTYRGFQSTPTGFIPSADMGYLLVNVQLPDSASSERTIVVMDQMESIAHKLPGIKHTQAMAGQSLLLSAFGSNFGSMFIILDGFANRPVPVADRFFRLVNLNGLERRWNEDWLGRPKRKTYDLEERTRKLLHLEKRLVNGKPEPSLYSEDIANELRKQFGMLVPEADIKVFGPPPVRGVGRAGGFKIMVEDRGDMGSAELQKQTDSLVDRGNKVHLLPDGELEIPGEKLGGAGARGAGRCRTWCRSRQGKSGRGRGSSGAGGPVHSVPRQCPPALCRREPDRMHDQGG